MATLLTGATGNVGAPLLEALRGRPGLRALVRADEGDGRVRAAGAQPVPGDLADGDSLRRALDGVERLLLLTPFVEAQAEFERNAVAAAKRAGVRHVVKLQALPNDDGSDLAVMRGHRAGVAALKEAGLPYTLVRASAYMTNLLGQAQPLAGGQLFFPYGPARVAWLDPGDVAAVLADVLSADAPPREPVDVTCPAALSFDELAEAIGHGLKAEVRAVDVPASAWEDSLVEAGLSRFYAHALAELFAWQQSVSPEAVTDTVQRLTGRAPRTVEQFAGDTLAPAVAATPPNPEPHDN